MIDIGVNLAHRRFAADLAEVLARARKVGVKRMVATGISVDASERALNIARVCPDVWCTAGVHPHEARSLDARGLARLRTMVEDDRAERIASLAQRGDEMRSRRACSSGPPGNTPRFAALAPKAQTTRRVVVLGECGLDYDRNFSEPRQQRWAFEAQLELAVELGMPVYLHEREAHDDFVAILGRYRDRLPRGVVHCFTGQARALDAYLDMDLHIGITGWICDRRRGAHLDAILPRIPSDRLMIETDAPFLTPPDAKSKRNEPAFLRFVLDRVARALDKPIEQVERETDANALAFFQLPSAL